ncbi:Glycerophosphodiester phosphodiesterase [Saliniradius amylolyticus]|uniref:glycerophosphodiester phosphodiesterase n=1 Tax=Saliniradius amylolyticus TaxID=2183582 RepID=A0A2S2E337_9ALTE|nr:glycerophosphodiester phosphodiesterase [Saliniradius amylolyticus]AWL11427.1 Glycerophosphodiester phosphodiesterase [Saliniradius amylolyticus]
MRLIIFLFSLCLSPFSWGDTAIIAHRGASAYLPEHTLEAAILAHGMNAHYIEQDLVLSADGIPVVLHDIHLDTITNVESVFPDRHRDDGRYYVIDFTLAELQELRVHERQTTDGQQVYPRRYPGQSPYRIATFEQHIQLIQGLNMRRDKAIGLYPEIKAPKFHQTEGQDISAIVVELLKKYDLNHPEANLYVQCFDFKEVKRLRTELGLKAPLVQLIGENDWQESGTDYEWLKTADGLVEVARYADGIGPWYHQLVNIENGQLSTTELARLAHQQGLLVHTYTLRADQLPEDVSFTQLSDYLIDTLGVDGIFTDFPDRLVIHQKPGR